MSKLSVENHTRQNSSIGTDMSCHGEYSSGEIKRDFLLSQNSLV